MMSLIVSPTGRVERQSITVIKRLHPQLDRAAVNWAVGAIFQPACRGDVPVRVRIQVPLDYKVSPVLPGAA